MIRARRGFTIRLNRLQPRTPDFDGTQNLGSKGNFQHFCNQLRLYFCFGSTHVFYYPAYKRSLCGRMSTADWSKWRWAFSVCGVEDWLLLRIIVEQSAWIHFSDYTRSARYSINMPWVCGQITSPHGFFISFIVTVFVPDIERIQNKIICLWSGTTCSVSVTSTCSADLFAISRRKPSGRTPNLK